MSIDMCDFLLMSRNYSDGISFLKNLIYGKGRWGGGEKNVWKWFAVAWESC